MQLHNFPTAGVNSIHINHQFYRVLQILLSTSDRPTDDAQNTINYIKQGVPYLVGLSLGGSMPT